MNPSSRPGSLSRALFHSLHAIAAAGLLLGGLCTATSRADILYVSNQCNTTINSFTSSDVRSLFADFDSGVWGPYGLACDSAGNLYAANFFDNMIEKFTPAATARFLPPAA